MGLVVHSDNLGFSKIIRGEWPPLVRGPFRMLDHQRIARFN